METTVALRELAAKVAKEELKEDERTREQNLTQFRDWIEKSPEIRNCRTDDSFLLRFLRSRKFNLLAAQKNLIKFLKVPKNFPYLEHLDMRDPAIDIMMSQGVEFVSPFRDENGRRVIILNIGNMDPRTGTHQDFTRTNKLNCCTLMEDQISQVLGYVYVVDLARIGLRHTALWPPVEFAKYTVALQTVYPMRFKEIHLINMPHIVRWFINIFKSVSTEKMQKRMFIHNTIEELHQAVNPKLLPEELGGVMPMKTMIELWKEQLEQHRETVLALDNIQLLKVKEDELQDINLYGLQGSFKTLCVD